MRLIMTCRLLAVYAITGKSEMEQCLHRVKMMAEKGRAFAQLK